MLYRPLFTAILVVTGLSQALVMGANWASAEDWNQWRGPRRDGTVAQSPPLIDALPSDGLKPLWVSDEKINAGENGFGSPVVAQGRVYYLTNRKQPGYEAPPRKFPNLSNEQRAKLSSAELADYDRQREAEEKELRRAEPHEELLTCLDAATGKLLWKNTATSIRTGFPQSATPLVQGGRVYWVGAGAVARCVDAETGTDVWRAPVPVLAGGMPLEEAVDSSVLLVDGVLISLAGRLVGLEAATGKVLWDTAKPKTGGREASPIVWKVNHQTFVIANLNDQETACLDPATGRELWRVKSEPSRSTPVLVGSDKLLIYGNSRKKGLKCYAISPEKAELLWTYQGTADPGASPVVSGNLAFVQGEEKFACVDLASGEERWLTELDAHDSRYVSPVAADGKILLAIEGLLVVAATGDEYRPRFRAKMAGDGTLLDAAASAENTNAAKPSGKKPGNIRPLDCASPALVDGRLFLRVKPGVACYDLRK